MKKNLVLSSGGYILKRINKSYVYEHRWLWEQNYGEIPTGFVIHHKDGNRQNNNICNLQLMPKKLHDSHTAKIFWNKCNNGLIELPKKPNQIDIPKNELLQHIKDLKSIRQISKIYNVTHGTVKSNIRRYNIDLTEYKNKLKVIKYEKQKIKQDKSDKKFHKTSLITKEILKKYLDQNYSQRKIAKKLGVSHTTIQRKINIYQL